MRQRPRPSALKMSEPRLGKWALRDYLYYQLNVGEILESPNGAPEQIAMQKSPRLDTYEVVLMAATQAEADRFLRLFEHAIHRHLSRPKRHRFTAFGLDQASRPEQLFDEIHWLNLEPASHLPQETLISLGRLVHIHFLKNSCVKFGPGFRTYKWNSEADLLEFWRSLYLSRDLCWFFGLDWDSYFAWQPQDGCVGTVNVGWGPTPNAAADALLESASAIYSSHSEGEILIIEGRVDTCIGDYVKIVEVIERCLDFSFATTSWVSADQSGYRLWLLRFCPAGSDTS